MLYYHPESAVSKNDSSAYFLTSNTTARSIGVRSRALCALLKASFLVNSSREGATAEPFVIFRLLQGLPDTSSAASLFIADSRLADNPCKSSFMSFSFSGDSLSPSV